MSAKISEEDQPICVVYIDDEGNVSYLKSPGARLFVVDERSPSDRTYEITKDLAREQIANFLDEDIGFIDDEIGDEVNAEIRNHGGKLH